MYMCKAACFSFFEEGQKYLQFTNFNIAAALLTSDDSENFDFNNWHVPVKFWNTRM